MSESNNNRRVVPFSEISELWEKDPDSSVMRVLEEMARFDIVKIRTAPDEHRGIPVEMGVELTERGEQLLATLDDDSNG